MMAGDDGARAGIHLGYQYLIEIDGEDVTEDCREVQAGEDGWVLCYPDHSRQLCPCTCHLCGVSELRQGFVRLSATAVAHVAKPA